MTEDRRAEQRVPANLLAKWDGLSGHTEARIEDISLGGCFVNTKVQVQLGEIVSLDVKLQSGEWLRFRGKVVSYQPGIGFGVFFSFLTGEEELALKRLITEFTS